MYQKKIHDKIRQVRKTLFIAMSYIFFFPRRMNYILINEISEELLNLIMWIL